MSSTTYVARRPGPFSALVQAAEIGGLQLHPLPPVRVRDRFYDTDDGALLRSGVALRVRDQDGALTAALRPLEGADAPASLPDDVPLAPAEAGRLDLPVGPFAEFVRGVVHGERLRVLLALRQYRTPRVAFEGDRPVGLLSFDVVVYEVPGAQVVSNEVEIEPMGNPGASDVSQLAAAFEERDLEPAAGSKFERGILRLPRTLTEPALLLPRERALLEAATASGNPLLQRRARVVLLDARGFRPDTIAAQTGLSMARVRHWRQRFREVRMGILEADPVGAPRRSLPRPAASRASVAAEGGPRDTFASAPPPPSPSPPVPVPDVPEDEPALEGLPSAPPVEGDGLPAGTAEDPALSKDMAELLEMFAPQETATPLLDEGPPPEGYDLEDDADEALDLDDDVEPEPPTETPDLAALPAPSVVDRGLSSEYPVVLGPFVGTAPASLPRRPSRGTKGLEAARRPGPSPSEGPLRRPTLSGDTPLLYAAQSVIAYHVAAFEDALDRLAAGRSDADARRLLIACHRVRLAVESFRAVVPDRAATRLLVALRPLVGDLDLALDLGRAVAADEALHPTLFKSRARALDSAVQRFRVGRGQEWGDRARRLLSRLVEQGETGLLHGDDFPLPPDDFVGDPGDLPVPSRLRHVVGSMLWARYEAIRAFEDDVDGEVGPDVAYHLAIAISGLHFALGLVENASTGPVRHVASLLDGSERRIATYRHQCRTVDLVVEVGGDSGPRPDPNVVRETWQSLMDTAFREQLAATLVGV